MDKELIRKYNIPGPRYTSYPTVPYWDESTFSPEKWNEHVKEAAGASNASEGISVYIHLPYCESLCTYCGCNKRITKNHGVEEPYIQSVIKEWEMYRELIGQTPRISEVHLGGGTPTFFSSGNLKKMMNGLSENAIITLDADLSFEAHPNNTTLEHLEELYALGFRRLSLGVQDFDLDVQTAIHRIQPYKMVVQAVEQARNVGYNSINFDLIYGLPKQTLPIIKDTVKKVLNLMPERIAFYSYAHVPWVSPGQRGYSDDDLPADEQKRELYEVGKEMFLNAGYKEIGMDHFALEEDDLCKADENGRLHRNFMGYTTKQTQLMVGLGVSSISDSWTAFAQNEKKVEDYMARIAEGELAIFRGHVLSEEDLALRRHILNLMCRHSTQWNEVKLDDGLMNESIERLAEAKNDGLLELTENGVVVTEKGKPFIRNICMAFDARLWRKAPTTKIFSSTV